VSLPWGPVPMGDSPGHLLRRLAVNPWDLSVTTNWVSGIGRVFLDAPQDFNASALAISGGATFKSSGVCRAFPSQLGSYSDRRVVMAARATHHHQWCANGRRSEVARVGPDDVHPRSKNKKNVPMNFTRYRFLFLGCVILGYSCARQPILNHSL
jgi:hypothetical protein